jgi:hypothetical protein
VVAVIAGVVLGRLASEEMFSLMEIVMASDDQPIDPEIETVKRTKNLGPYNFQNSTSRS